MNIAMVGFCFGINELVVHFIKKNGNKIIGNNNAQCSIEYEVSCVSHHDSSSKRWRGILCISGRRDTKMIFSQWCWRTPFW
jgi:hypothetical protein